MIFIIRTENPEKPPFEVKMARQTPAIVSDGAGRTDYFCLADPDAARAAGWPVVAVHDGWYADDTGGGMAIWGQGLFWEVRDTRFTVRQACGKEAWPDALKHHDDLDALKRDDDRDAPKRDDDEALNVRQAIFRG